MIILLEDVILKIKINIILFFKRTYFYKFNGFIFIKKFVNVHQKYRIVFFYFLPTEACSYLKYYLQKLYSTLKLKSK